MKGDAKWGGKTSNAIHIAIGDSSDRIAALFVATVMTKNNVTTSMGPVPTGVMTAIKEVIVHKCAITTHMDQHARLPVATAFICMENNVIT